MYESLFNTDGSLKVIPAFAKTELSDAPGTYVLDGITEPEIYEGKCLLVIPGTTQQLNTAPVLLANGKIYYKYNDEWVIVAERECKVDIYGRIKKAYLPEGLQHCLGVVDVFPHTAASGDWAICNGELYYYTTEWKQITYPVTSVNGKTGDVTLEIDDIPSLREAFDTNDANAAEFTRITEGELSPVIGLCVRQTPGSYQWFRIDQYGYPVEPTKTYFDRHPIYSKIRRCSIDGQVMQEHSKFYYKAIDITEGPFAGHKGRLISPEKLDGFKAFPSFMKDGSEIDKWYCGAFQASVDSNNKLCSLPGQSPCTNVSIATHRTYAQNRGTNWDIWNIYQCAENQLLAAIEAGTTDAPTYYGTGKLNTSVISANDFPIVASSYWRGHVGLWGNIWQHVNGIQINSSGKVQLWNKDGTREWITTSFSTPTCTGWSYRYGSLATNTGTNYDFNDIFYPGTIVAEDSGNDIIPDNFIIQTGTVLGYGGQWTDQPQRPGLFAFGAEHNESTGSTWYGTRLAYYDGGGRDITEYSSTYTITVPMYYKNTTDSASNIRVTYKVYLVKFTIPKDTYIVKDIDKTRVGDCDEYGDVYSMYTHTLYRISDGTYSTITVTANTATSYTFVITQDSTELFSETYDDEYFYKGIEFEGYYMLPFTDTTYSAEYGYTSAIYG